jgi:uncharacterized protein (TIGR02679 family)
VSKAARGGARGSGQEQVRALLGGPEYRRLLGAVRERLERGGGAARSLTLPALDDRERAALAGLLGWPTVPAGRVRLHLAELDAALRASRLGCGVAEALEALDGPLRDRRAERDRERGRNDVMWQQAQKRAGHPALADWLDELRRRGLLARAARNSDTATDALLGQALELAGRLPARGVLLQSLAAEATGDAHALDPGRPLAGLVLRAAARLAGWSEVPRAAAGRRRLWAEVGVLCDPLSSHVLVLGLRPSGAGRLARNLGEAAIEGEPLRLTLRELQPPGAGMELPAPEVFVCENPAVVAAAADRLGSRSAPLVCTEGLPSTAAAELLAGLASGGATLRVQCDFDWGGLRIGNLLLAGPAARPWRFTAADYLRLLERTAARAPLGGEPVDASWDPDLRPALERVRTALFEEQMLDELLGDLADARNT